MAPLDSREEKIAEVRRALDTLQRLSMQLEAKRPLGHRPSPQLPERLWIDPTEQSAPNALVTSKARSEPPPSRKSLVPFAVALGAAGTAAAAAFAVVVGAVDLSGLFGKGAAGPSAQSSATQGAAQPASSNGLASPQGAATRAGSEQQPVGGSGPSDTQVASTDPAASAPEPGPQSGPSQIPSAAPPGVEPLAAEAAVTKAQQLFTDGKVLEARQVLSLAQPEQSPDVAWALARSYDPRFLSTIRGADASADVDTAERWYRTWHEAAQKQGLISNNMPVDKIIESMR